MTWYANYCFCLKMLPTQLKGHDRKAEGALGYSYGLVYTPCAPAVRMLVSVCTSCRLVATPTTVPDSQSEWIDGRVRVRTHTQTSSHLRLHTISLGYIERLKKTMKLTTTVKSQTRLPQKRIVYLKTPVLPLEWKNTNAIWYKTNTPLPTTLVHCTLQGAFVYLNVDMAGTRWLNTQQGNSDNKLAVVHNFHKRQKRFHRKILGMWRTDFISCHWEIIFKHIKRIIRCRKCKVKFSKHLLLFTRMNTFVSFLLQRNQERPRSDLI